MLDRNEIEILQVALAHEERARKFYERLASACGATPAGDLFTFLAAEERGHIEKLCAVHRVPPFEASWEEGRLPELADLERVAWEDGEEAAGAPGEAAVRKGLAIAARAEGAAASFYASAARTAESREARDLLAWLESEERIHLARVERYIEELRGR